MMGCTADETFLSKICFCDETTFHLSKNNRSNIRIRGGENPHAVVEQLADNPKIKVFCALCCDKIYGPVFFGKNI
jgi:hypothetical protein